MQTLTTRRTIARLESVDVDYGGRKALRGITTTIESGILTVVVGPNGAGKSTLLDVLTGTLIPSAGRVTTETSAVAFVPQRAAVGDRLPVSVRDVVTIGTWGRLGPWRRADAATRRSVDEALERLDLTPLHKRRLAELSGGQRQRALLAQALARGAELLLLDEPTSALDAESSARIRAAMADEVTRGAAVVCVTHDRDMIDAADRLLRLEDGRLVD